MMLSTSRNAGLERLRRFEHCLQSPASNYKLKSSVSVRRESSGDLLLFQMGNSYKIGVDQDVWGHQSLVDLLRLLRRGASGVELSAVLPADLDNREKTLHNFLLDLYQIKMLLWPDPLARPWAKQVHPDWLNLLSHFVDEEVHLETSKIQILGGEGSPGLAKAIQNEIHEAPALELALANEKPDLVIALSSESDYDQLSQLNRKFLKVGQVWMAVVEDSFGGILSSFMGRAGDACFECLRIRLFANSWAKGNDLISRDFFADQNRSVGLIQRQFAGRIVLEALKYGTDFMGSPLERGILSFDMLNHRSEYHELFPSSSCVECRGGHSVNPPRLYSFLDEVQDEGL